MSVPARNDGLSQPCEGHRRVPAIQARPEDLQDNLNRVGESGECVYCAVHERGFPEAYTQRKVAVHIHISGKLRTGSV